MNGDNFLALPTYLAALAARLLVAPSRDLPLRPPAHRRRCLQSSA